MDCLKKLTHRLPEYQRVLDVVICIVESGLYANATTTTATTSSLTLDDATSSQGTAGQKQHQRFYFEEYQALHDSLEDARALLSQTTQQNSLHTHRTIREQIANLLLQLSDDEPLEKEQLFLSFLQSNMDVLSCLACGEILKFFVQHSNPEKKRFFYTMFMNQLTAGETKRVLQEVANSHVGVFRTFLQENLDVMDKILMDVSSITSSIGLGSGANGSSVTSHALFQRLIERHPAEFASILWQSPFLTAHIFQVSLVLPSKTPSSHTPCLSPRMCVCVKGFAISRCSNTGAKHLPCVPGAHPEARCVTLLAEPHAQRQHGKPWKLRSLPLATCSFAFIQR